MSLFDGHVRLRIAGGRFFNKLLREGELTPAQAASVRKLTRNSMMLDDFYSGLPALENVGPEVMAAVGEGTPFLDWISKAVEKLWTNREAILAFILQLVDLFT